MNVDQIRRQASGYEKLYRFELLENCIPFWIKSDWWDKKHGGFITSVDRCGKSYNDDKSVWFQGRSLWTLALLCDRYGTRPEWEAATRAGKAFLEAHCTDTDGRMFFTVTQEGKPLRKRRYLFSESFFVLGIARYGLVFGDAEAVAKASACFDFMLKIHRSPENDPYKITPKGISSTRSERSVSILMMLLCCAQTLRLCKASHYDYYTRIAAEITDEIFLFHLKPDLCCMLETVLSDGSFLDNPVGRAINPGHSCESAWFLLAEFLATGDPRIRDRALQLLDWSLNMGWDSMCGGIFYFVDVKQRPCEQLEWDMKLWWVHNEALIATLLAYHITENQKYWNWFKKIHNFAFSNFPDRKFGEWYGYLHRDGSVSHTQKGSLWKGPFHLPRCLMLCEEILHSISEGTSLSLLL